ncbi:MAG: hypothetical protein QOI92_210, partial [Chloroflexota bacterium]|nr:hypothetical protein [Chloroflexota bacterium]
MTTASLDRRFANFRAGLGERPAAPVVRADRRSTIGAERLAVAVG